MKFHHVASLAASLASLASAQTPSGFVPAVTAKLDVIFGAKSVTPGMAMTKAETARIPTIGTQTPLTGTYLFMVIDLDVPANFANPSAGGRRTNLHAMVSGFKAGATTPTAEGTYVLASTASTPAAYMGPAPPAERPPYAHRYVELLFEQPAAFAVPSSQTRALQSRIGFDVVAFATAAGLGAPIAANYFNVTG